MRLEEKDGLRILYPESGYWIKNKETGDVHTGRIYLSAYATIDIYEEVKNEAIDDVSNLDKSKDVSLEQPRNILTILVAFEVLKLLTSRDVSAEHLWNIPYILATIEVSQPLTSKEVSDEQL